jgi:hypothetical protein
MITGIVVAAIILGIGTWLRWVSRPATISIKYILDLDQKQGHSGQPQIPVQVPRGRMHASSGH